MGSQLVKKFPAFYGTCRFINAFTTACHMSVSWATSIQSIPTIHILKMNLKLSSHLFLGVPVGLFPSGFATKTLYTPSFSPILATCPAYLILLDLFTRIIFGEEYRSFSSSLCSFLQSLITLSLLEPNTFFSTLFSNTLSLHFSFNMSDQVSHPYATTGKL